VKEPLELSGLRRETSCGRSYGTSARHGTTVDIKHARQCRRIPISSRASRAARGLPIIHDPWGPVGVRSPLDVSGSRTARVRSRHTAREIAPIAARIASIMDQMLNHSIAFYVGVSPSRL
jgi:hypothetical protein